MSSPNQGRLQRRWHNSSSYKACYEKRSMGATTGNTSYSRPTPRVGSSEHWPTKSRSTPSPYRQMSEGDSAYSHQWDYYQQPSSVSISRSYSMTHETSRRGEIGRASCRERG